MLESIQRSALLLGVALLPALGCSKPASSKPAPVVSAAPSSASTGPLNAPGIDAELLQQLHDLGRQCQVVPGEDRVNCGGKNWKLVSDFLSKRRARSPAVATLAAALSDADPGVRGLAVAVLRGGFGGGWAKDPAAERVDPAAARALLQVAVALPPASAAQLMPAVVQAAMLSDQSELLHKELLKAPRAPLRLAAYPYLMSFGRLKELGRVERIVKGSDLEAALAAIEAPLIMSNWSAEEEAAICGWASQLLVDERASVATKGALLLANCSGEGLDKLLEHSKKLAAAGRLDAKAQGALMLMCGSGQPVRPSSATEPQRKRARQLLEQLAESKQATPADRAHALTAVADLWRDEQSARLLKRLAQDKDGYVATQAREAAKKLAEPAVEQASSSLP